MKVFQLVIQKMRMSTIRTWGEKPQFGFEAKPHWDLADDLDILDFERAGKVTGSRFVFYKGFRCKVRKSSYIILCLIFIQKNMDI